MKPVRWGRLVGMIAGATAMLGACVACGQARAAQAAPRPPEIASLRVTTLPIVDDAPLFIAIKKGYFAEEGLSVSPVAVTSGPESLAKVQSGAADIGFGNYVTDILAESQGQRLRILADGFGAAPNVFMIVVRPNSPIRAPAQLAEARIAVNAPQNIGALLVFSALKPYGVEPARLKLVPMPFPKMAEALANGTVDAAWLTEPFLSEAAQNTGAVELLDAAKGATENLPIAGYVATERFAASAPRTVAAFQRAMARAATDAANREQVLAVIPDFIHGVTPQTASILTLGSYPVTLNRTRIQRVADLMTEFGLLKAPFDVTPMVRR